MDQMIIQLPEDDTDAGRICNYLKTANVTARGGALMQFDATTINMLVKESGDDIYGIPFLCLILCNRHSLGNRPGGDGQGGASARCL